MRVITALDSARDDIRDALRGCRKHPSFTLAVLLTLALGIGANSAMFSIVDAVLLRPLPYPDADRLVLVARRFPNGGLRDATDGNRYVFWRDHQTTLAAIAAVQDSRAVSLDTTDSPERLTQSFVTADFFRVLRMPPVVGRDFLPNEDRPDAAPVAILSYELWARRFARDPGVIGRAVTFSGDPYTIVGVAPPGVDPNLSADLWTPRAVERSRLRAGSNFVVIGRLKDAVSRERARADFEVIAAQYQTSAALPAPDLMDLLLYQRWMVSRVEPMLLLLFGAVALVLLIACANVANLFVVRMTDRTQDVAVRRALGASRARIAALLLTESLALALAGAAAGLLIAPVILGAIVSSNVVRLPGLADASLGARVMLFTGAVAIGTATLVGIWPAFQAARTELSPALQAGARMGVGRRTEQVRRTLVLVQFALSLVLLIAATLIVESVVNLYGVAVGLDTRRLLTTRMTLAGERYSTSDRVADFAAGVVQEVRRVPGVTQAAVANALPLSRGFNSSFNIPVARIEGREPPPDGFIENVGWTAVTPTFFETLGIPRRAGRGLSDGDAAGSPLVVVVNETFARRHFAGDRVMGQRILLAWHLLGPDHEEGFLEIVGIVGDIRDTQLQATPRSAVYVPLSQVNDAVGQVVNGIMPTTLFVRGERPAALARVVQAAVHDVDPLIPVHETRTMEQVIGASVAPQRFVMWLLGGFAVVAMLLASVGLYGVMAYAVARRTREIGIRAALGADPHDLMAMVLRQGTLIATAGIVLGIGGALALMRLLEALLFGVTAREPVTFVVTSLVLALVALAATYLPARRAAAVDPALALRES